MPIFNKKRAKYVFLFLYLVCSSIPHHVEVNHMYRDVPRTTSYDSHPVKIFSMFFFSPACESRRLINDLNKFMFYPVNIGLCENNYVLKLSTTATATPIFCLNFIVPLFSSFVYI